MHESHASEPVPSLTHANPHSEHTENPALRFRLNRNRLTRLIKFVFRGFSTHFDGLFGSGIYVVISFSI